MKIWLLALALAFGSFNAFAQAPKAKEVVSKHDKLFANMDHLKVEFKQIIHTSLRNKTRTRDGVASFSKPGNFYWQYKEGGNITEEYYYDGKVLSHYRPPEKTVTHYGTQSGLQKELQAIVSLVLDAEKLLAQYEAQNVKSAKGKTTLSLIPKNKQDTDIVAIQVTVSEKPKYVQDVKIEYKNGNYSAFSFTNPSTKPIPAKTFQFPATPGVKEKRMG